MPLPAYERGARRRTSRPCESPGRRGGGGGRLCGKPRGPVWAGKRESTDTAALLRSETSCTGGAPSSRHLAAHAHERTNTSTVSMGLPAALASNDGCGALKPRAAEPSAVSPSLSGRLSDPSDARPGQNSLISQDECACSPPPLIRPTCFYGSEESGRRRGMWERGSAEAAAEPIATVWSRCGQLAA